MTGLVSENILMGFKDEESDKFFKQKTKLTRKYMKSEYNRTAEQSAT